MSNAETAPARSARSGGRAARRAVRAAPLTEDIKPVRAGMEGGEYKPLSDSDVQKVHEAFMPVIQNMISTRRARKYILEPLGQQFTLWTLKRTNTARVTFATFMMPPALLKVSTTFTSSSALWWPVICQIHSI